MDAVVGMGMTLRSPLVLRTLYMQVMSSHSSKHSRLMAYLEESVAHLLMPTQAKLTGRIY